MKSYLEIKKNIPVVMKVKGDSGNVVDIRNKK